MPPPRKPGACHIELPEDVADAPAEDLDPIRKSRPTHPVPDQEVIFDALQVIRQAKSPVILAGNGTIRLGASGELRKFAESTGIGVINTFMAKGVINQDSVYLLFTGCTLRTADKHTASNPFPERSPAESKDLVGERACVKRHIETQHSPQRPSANHRFPECRREI